LSALKNSLNKFTLAMGKKLTTSKLTRHFLSALKNPLIEKSTQQNGIDNMGSPFASVSRTLASRTYAEINNTLRFNACAYK